ncbi:MAG: gliding motility-associated C-terminal domain-containing protein [Salibacteraceae bacterium]
MNQLQIKFYVLVLACFNVISALAQTPNLLDNPSFENYVNCPFGLGDINDAYWDKAPFHTGSSDYFNACSASGASGVPNNTFGPSLAYQGDAYTGGYIGLQSNAYREYIFDTLLAPLQANKRYEVSFAYRLAPNARFAGDDLGFYLSTTVPTGTGTGALGVTPQSQNPAGNYLTNSTWEIYADTIIAAGGEQYITIGAFDAVLPVILANQTASIGGAYLYFDAISVHLLEGIDGDSTVCIGDTAQIYAFEMDSVHWVNSNNPTVVIDTADTIYVSPTTTTTYWCISTVDTFEWTVQVISPISNFAGPDTSFCETETFVRSLNLPNYDFLWSTNDTTSSITIQDSGQYWVEVSLYGCTSYDTFNVEFLGFPDFDLGLDQTICWYDTITLDPNVTSNSTANNNVDYQWNTGSTNSSIEVNTPGYYWVDITNIHCTRRDSIEIIHHPTVTVDLGVDQEFCYSNSEPIIPNAQNATSYQWSTGSQANQISVSTTNTYMVTATGNGCHAYDSVQYTFYHDPYFDLPESIMYCKGDTVTVTTGLDPTNLSFLWNTGITDTFLQVSDGSRGNYWVQVSDDNCTMRDTVFIDMYDPIDLELGEDVKFCEGESFEIVPNTDNSYNYQWSNGSSSQSINVSSSGIFSVTVSDANCQETDKIRVFFFEYPEIDLGDDITLCAPGQLEFDVTSSWQNVRYNWYDGTTTPRHIMYADKDQTLWVRLTNEVCSTSDSLNVHIATPPFLRLPKDTIICEDEVAIVQPETNGSLRYLWSNGDTIKTLTTSSSGVYVLTVDDGTCVSKDTVEVKAFETPKLEISAPEYICIGETEVLDATIPNVKYYLWEDGSSSPTLSIYEPGFYSVLAYHDCGVEKDTVLIQDCECFVRFPNAFKPVPSGINKTFGAVVDCELLSFELRIYDRWGKLVFETKDQNTTWDGKINNQIAPVGSYGYVCEYKALYDGEPINRNVQGSVTIIR